MQATLLQPETAVEPAYKAVLRACGYPTDVMVIDFETYFDSEYSLKTMSTVEYINDPRFEILTCAFTTEKGGTHVYIGEGVEEVLRGHCDDPEHVCDWWDTFTIVAQNAAFDCSILAHRFGIYPRFIIDVMGLSRHLHARSKHDLGSQAKRAGLQDKGDTKEFTGLSFRTRFRKPSRGPKIPMPVPKITDEQLQRLIAYNRNDNLLEWELFTKLLPQISNPIIELPLIQHHIELFTRPTLKVDFAKGAELIDEMRDKIADAIPYGYEEEEISGNKSFEAALMTAIEKAGESPIQYTKFGKHGAMLAIAKGDDSREKLLNHPNATVRKLMEARVAVKSWPLHISRVQGIMDQAKATGGLLGIPLKYYGAHTGRSSGGEGINPQNLGSKGDPLITAVRHIIIAPDGSLLVIVDAAAIEARVLAWIAGQDDLVVKFAAGAEVYCDLAAKISGQRVVHPKTCAIPQIKARMEKLRGLGKVGVLGCGYGMGKERALDYANGAPYFLGITQADADKIVDTYRQENAQIVKFWYDCERSFTRAFRYHTPVKMDRGLTFFSKPDCDVVIRLPNGRELRYPQVRNKDSLEVFNSLYHKWDYIWGGTIVENIVQAISRDVLMEAMLRLEKRGYHTALHVHDELVLVVPADQAETALAAAIEEMSRTPTWGPRMPLAAEGKISTRYTK